MEGRQFRAPDFWSALALAALGTYIVVQASQWEYLGSDGPGPGFFPLWYGIAIAVLSLGLMISAAFGKRTAGGERIDWAKVRRALVAWLGLVAAVVAFKLVGFVIGFALLAFFIAAVMYRRPVAVAATVAVAMAIGFYLLFSTVLGVRLPTGLFGF
jgi:putative tricarboxylic transport membrane protein